MMPIFNGRVQQKRDTTSHWTALTGFVPLEGEIIVYTDRYTDTDDDGNTIYYPGIKIGDGKAFCVDLPFVDDYETQQILEQLQDHINDSSIHTSIEEKTNWNNKISCSVSDERLIFF